MWTIDAGGVLIPCLTIHDEVTNQGGVMLPCAKIFMSEDITPEQIRALMENPWNIYDDDGQLMGVKSGYNRIRDYCLAMLKVQDADSMQIQLEAVTRELAARKIEAEKILAAVASTDEKLRSVCGLIDSAGLSIEELTRLAEIRKAADAQEPVQQ